MAEEREHLWSDQGVAELWAAYDVYRARFDGITSRARRHFERRDWNTAQRDSAQRLDVYTECLDLGMAHLRERLGALAGDRATWHEMRERFPLAAPDRDDLELAETFFNSCARRAFHTIGVDPDVEFVALAGTQGPRPVPRDLTRTFRREDRLEDMLRAALEANTFACGWDDLAGDVARITAAVVAQADERRIQALEFARPVFFRGKAAYLVGRLLTNGPPMPFLVALRNPAGRVVVDAVLLAEDEVSIVFSFARSYFLVAHERPSEIVDYLRALMPRKQMSELYTSLGFDRHGKTELYRSILRHLATTDDCFEIAPGQRGMVMCVFTLPGFDVVFKVIRDRFDPPKTVTHAEVRDKYRLVFRHDRAGRLVDAQSFEHLEFARARFAPALLEELLERAGETVRVEGERVIIRHLYTERRLRPLDLYLREAEPEAARDAVTDYGQVMRDLAATDIFPGDMLLKNFGVSRHGRLIFYDYDELVLLSECRFRELPQSSDDGDSMAGEPWYYVGERDIFPEEFRTFLGLQGDLLQTFLAHHAELLGVAFWHRMQELHAQGEVLDIYPYRATRRLRRGSNDPDVSSQSLPPQEPAP